MFINSISDLFSFHPEGGGGGSGGTGDNNDPKPDTVTREAFDRVLGETKAEREKRKTLETELSAYKEKERLAAEADALKRGEFDTLIKAERDKLAAKDAEIEAERVKAKKLEDRQIYMERSSSFLTALGVPLDKRFWDLVDVSKIEVNADGEVDQASATKYANDFKTQYADILTKGGTTNFPNGKPQGGGGIGWSDAKTLKEKYESLPDAVARRTLEVLGKK